MLRTYEDKVKRDFGYKTHAFNTLISDSIGSYRDLLDTRNKM